MHPYSNTEIPTVAICNTAEAFFEFLSRAEEPAALARLIRERQFKGERALLWLGDPKLVFTSFRVPRLDYWQDRLGYRGTRQAAPASPTAWLCSDIMREPALIEQLLDYVGSGRTAKLIPYATTSQFLKLVDLLEREYQLTVVLPETPARESVWVRDYVDTKSGFRSLATNWLPQPSEWLPQGMICHNLETAAAAAGWFQSQGRTCIIKPDNGENGFGQHRIPADNSIPSDILKRLRSDPFLQRGPVIVEEFITSPQCLSPSIEFYVPPLGSGKPEITYLSNQLFTDDGNFCGVLVSRELLEAPWYPPLAEKGLLIADNLQRMGYAGVFDLDTIVDEQQHPFLLEINSRRTGGTHVHEFARFAFGPNYLDQTVLLSDDMVDSQSITQLDSLEEVIDDLLYPMQGERRGVVFTITSTLPANRFGCIFVAPSTVEALDMRRALTERISQASERLHT
jgi:hypothetical protein